MNLDYKINTATEEQIFWHLTECNDRFIPPLNEKVNVLEYSKKIYDHSVRFEAWSDGVLAGLIASYFNNIADKIGFITNVSVLENHTRQGIANKLLGNCIEYAKSNGFKEIGLEVMKDNIPAINLYEKFGFSKTNIIKDGFITIKLKI